MERATVLGGLKGCDLAFADGISGGAKKNMQDIVRTQGAKANVIAKAFLPDGEKMAALCREF